MRCGEVQLGASGERATQSFGVVQGGIDDGGRGLAAGMSSGPQYQVRIVP